MCPTWVQSPELCLPTPPSCPANWDAGARDRRKPWALPAMATHTLLKNEDKSNIFKFLYVHILHHALISVWVYFEQSQEAWAWLMVLAYLFSPFNTVNISKSDGEPLCCDHHLKSYYSQRRTWNLELAATNGLLTAQKEVILQFLTQEHWREKSSFESSREACWLAKISSWNLEVRREDPVKRVLYLSQDKLPVSCVCYLFIC